MAPSASAKDLVASIEGVNSDSFKSDNERYELLKAARKLCERLETPFEFQARTAWTQVCDRTLQLVRDGLTSAIGI